MLRVSIITVSLNSEKTIRQTLESVLSQSYKHIEHIVIDGGSEDDTLSICNEFSHLSKIVSEPDKGIYDAMNKGLRLAKGDVIAILNSDDFFYNDDVVADVVSVFLKNEKVGIVYGDTLVGKFGKQGELEKITRIIRPGKFDRMKFNSGWMPPHVSVYIRKRVYERHGLFSTNFVIGGDYELLLRFMYKEKVHSFYFDKPCVCFRIGGVSTAGLKNRVLMLKESKKAWEMNKLRTSFLTPYLKMSRGLLNLITTKLERLANRPID